MFFKCNLYRYAAGPAPANIRRLNNHAACRIMKRIGTHLGGAPLYVKLVGLRGAAHLNGLKGVIQHDASNTNNLASSSDRIVVSLDDGKQVCTWMRASSLMIGDTL
jgi:hypothetical protein